MKKPNQIKKNRKAASLTAQPKAERRRVRVKMPVHLSRAIRAKAKRENISVSQLAELAIRKQLPLIEAAIAEIPKDSKEVACIDFTGYLDRDCEERIIYKTPQGTLKAARHSYEEPEVIENVTRGQVLRWILECVIPQEFEADFRRCSAGSEVKN